MKKIISTLFLLHFLVPASFSKDIIEGLGKLRINMQESEFLPMLIDNYYGVPLSINNHIELAKVTDRKVCKINYDVISKNMVFYKKCKRARMYFLRSFSIGDNTEIIDTYVTFFDSILIDINSKFSPELQKNLEEKFEVTEPIINISVAENPQCNTILDFDKNLFKDFVEDGKVENVYRISIDYNFRNDTVIARASIAKFLDNNCINQAEKYIRIYNNALLKEFAKCN